MDQAKNNVNIEHLKKLAALIRYWILKMTNKADSGHPTSSMSAVELMTVLMFGGIFRYNLAMLDHPNNDRLIFSKGHASPLFYALWTAANAVFEDELKTYREFGSRLEGHPGMAFPYTEAATGSLGQGLSIGLGMALNAKYIDKLPYKSYVLLGDGEMAEGSQWEAIQLASHYELNNLIGILDVNRLGQCGETMYGHNLTAYEQRISAFGWQTIAVQDGHNIPALLAAYRRALTTKGKPTMIIARTIKGKGVPSVEDVNGYHGKALGDDALKEFIRISGKIDLYARGEIVIPKDIRPPAAKPRKPGKIGYTPGNMVATRDAYGAALERIFPHFPDIVVMDGEVSNSTRSEKFRGKYPERFFEMFIAEQNMAGTALGLAQRGKHPFISSFAAFWTRAFDQIRMSAYSNANIVFAGSHAGASIGRDGPSQMGLEDIAMFRSVLNSTVLYPSDAVAADKLVETAAELQGIVYLRLTRGKTPVLYAAEEKFPVGGSKTLRHTVNDTAAIVTAGYTLHEALAACNELHSSYGIAVRVIDLYSIKPIDRYVLEKALEETGRIVVVEDHYPEGGIGEAVFSVLRGKRGKLEHLAVRRSPGSGSPEDILRAQWLNCDAIMATIRKEKY